MSGYANRERLAKLYQQEVDSYVDRHPGSKAAHERATENLLGGVPMIWMKKWPGPFPLYVNGAKGSHFQDVDGNDFTDLCLGDTGAMTGHSPQRNRSSSAGAGRKRRHVNASHRKGSAKCEAIG